MNYQQHSDPARLIPDRADCVPPLFARRGIDAIRADEAMLVLERQSSQFE
jgi:hypothetical protein